MCLSLADNYIPFCSVFYPKLLLKEALGRFDNFGDFLEDYAFFLSVNQLKPDITTFPTVIAGVSVRDDGTNAVTCDRESWDCSYATFMHELIRQKQVSRLEFSALPRIDRLRPSTAGNYLQLMLRLQRIDAKLHKIPRIRASLIYLVKMIFRF
jgi:hypothetical protein